MTAKAVADGNKTGLKMKYKILLAMILVSLIPIGGLWYISIYNAEQEAVTSVYQQLKNSADNLAEKVDSWHDMNLLILQQNSATPSLQSMEAGRQDPVLKTITDNYKWVYLAFTILPNGQNVGRSDGKPPQPYGDRKYFQQVIGGQMVGREVVIGKTSGKPALILAIPLYGADNSKKGVFAFAMSLEDLSKSVTDVSFGQSGNAILLDEQNRVVAKNKELLSSLEDLGAHPSIIAAGKGDKTPVVFTEKGKRMLAWSKTTKHGWKVILQQDYDEAFAFMTQTRQSAMLLLALTLAFTIAVAFLLSAGLAGPIKRLTEAADGMSRGELDTEMRETQRQDEIGDLARAIERMGISLKMALQRMRK
jgi:methyl-accepting chemotaxis protein